jgi:hypothetical protein
MPLIYLAGAIDKQKDDPFVWASKVSAELVARWSRLPTFGPLLIYNPYTAFSQSKFRPITPRDAKTVYEINAVALMASDLLILHYEPGQETWGSPQELLWFAAQEKPIAVWADNMKQGDNFPLYLVAHMTDEFLLPFDEPGMLADSVVDYLKGKEHE